MGVEHVGAAQFGGVEDVLKRAMSASYSLGSGAKPEEQTAKHTSVIATQMVNMGQVVQNLSDWMVGMLPALLMVEGPKAVGEFVFAAYDRIRKEVGNVVNNVKNTTVDTPIGSSTIGGIIDAGEVAAKNVLPPYLVRQFY